MYCKFDKIKFSGKAYNVLIVAKCIVNSCITFIACGVKLVLIVAKCIVNDLVSLSLTINYLY